MLYPSYYIITTPGLLKTLDKGVAEGIFVLQIDLANIKEFYTAISDAKTTFPFCLYVIAPDIDENTANDLLAFFFFPDYTKQQGQPLIFISSENRSKRNSLLSDCAIKQGFNRINFKSIGEEILAEEEETIKQKYNALLRSKDTSIESLYIKINQPEDIAHLASVVTNVEEQFKKDNNDFFLLKQQNEQLATRVEELERLYNAAQQEISNLQSHNAILKSSSQATHLQNYYNNEYEVLPLWFKKLGQLIKVLSGKRSFRSLFNKSVKKYND